MDAAAVIEAKVCGIIAGVCVPIPGGFHPEHMCDVLKCPLKANTAYSITETVYINKTWPSVSMNATSLIYQLCLMQDSHTRSKL